jgi:Flp pilus assembly protein TadG
MISDERGSATLELALITPALMLVILGVLQFGLVYHANHVADAAAQEAARLLAAEGSQPDRGRSRATEVLAAGLGKIVEAPAVLVTPDPEIVRVRVETTMRGLLPLPGLSRFRVSAEASAYAERFRPAGE